MTKMIRQCVAGLLALGMVLMPGQVLAQTYFWWNVVDEFGRNFPSQTISCSVYDLASHGAKELFLSSTLARHLGMLTSMPLLSDANSRLHFYSATTDDIRVVCFYARGGAATDIRLSRFTHTVMIDRQGRKVVRFPFATSTAQTRTGIWIPQGAIIRDILVQNVFYGSQAAGSVEDNVNSEPHLNVGFSGEHAVSVSHSLVNRMHLFGQPLWVRPGIGQVFRPYTGAIGGRFEDTGFGVHRGQALAVAPRGAVSGPANHQGSSSAREVSYVVHVGSGLELVYQTSGAPNTTGHVFVIYESYHTGVSTTPVGN